MRPGTATPPTHDHLASDNASTVSSPFLTPSNPAAHAPDPPLLHLGAPDSPSAQLLSQLAEPQQQQQPGMPAGLGNQPITWRSAVQPGAAVWVAPLSDRQAAPVRGLVQEHMSGDAYQAGGVLVQLQDGFIGHVLGVESTALQWPPSAARSDDGSGSSSETNGSSDDALASRRRSLPGFVCGGGGLFGGDGNPYDALSEVLWSDELLPGEGEGEDDNALFTEYQNLLQEVSRWPGCAV